MTRLKTGQVVAFRQEPLVGLLASFCEVHEPKLDQYDLALVNTWDSGYTGKCKDITHIYQKTPTIYYLLYSPLDV